MPLEARSEVLVAVSVVVMAISLLTVSFRCFVRWRMLKAFGWDDTLMVLAMVRNPLEISVSPDPITTVWQLSQGSLDDESLTCFQVLDIVLTACAIAGAKDGVGRHLSNFHSFDEFHHAMLVRDIESLFTLIYC